ncbi:MAG: DUF11 domain-containing protein, partial [Actinomycetia bacterium]|nr:DUF11 domain-containing protein [Actinomycetes bacterium]
GVTKNDGGITAEPGDEIVYTITVENLGNQDATGVQVSETVPDHTTLSPSNDPAWSCLGTIAGSTCTLDIGNVAAGAAPRTIDFAVLIDPTVPAGVTEIANTTSVADDGSSGPDLDPSNNSAGDQTPLSLSGTGPDLVIVKDDGGIAVDPGDTVLYTLPVETLGNQDAEGVVVSETVPEDTTFLTGSSDPAWICSGTTAGSSCSLSLGAIAAGATPLSIDFSVLVDSPVGAGVVEILNTASIADDGTGGPDLNPANNIDSDQTPLSLTSTGPDLVVTKTDGDTTTSAGDLITYTLTVANHGNQDATGVVLSDTIPVHSSFNAAGSAPGWSCDASACTLAVGALGAGDAAQSFAIAFAVEDPLAAGVTEINNSATTADDGTSGPDLNPVDNSASDQTPLSTSTGPDLVIDKHDGGITVNPGDTIVYSISVENLGNQDAASVQISETVPQHSAFLPTVSDSRWICAGTAGGSSCTLNLGSLPADSPREAFAYAVRVDSTVPAGLAAIANSASVSSADDDLDPSNNLSSEDTPLAAGTGPDLSITKSDGGITADAGDTIAYAISVENLGNQDATGVVVSETVPEHTTLLAGSSDPRWSCVGTSAGSSCTLDLGPLPVGRAPQLLAYSVRVDFPVPAGVTAIVNSASISGVGDDLDPANDTSSDTTPLNVTGGTGPDLSITKSDGRVTGNAGEPVLYTLRVSNSGNQDAAGVIVSETV